MSQIAWGAKVSPEFRRKVVRIATDVCIDPSWLMACMQFESRLNPAARNPGSSATGLIQFMDATARSLGTTTGALADMSAEEQLDYVARYFKPYTGRISCVSDCYMAILWPSAIGADPTAVIFNPGSKAYLANRGLDIDHDGAVTKLEACARVIQLLADGMQPGNVGEVEFPGDVSEPLVQEPKPMLPILAALLPSIVQAIPSLIGVFGSGGEISQRNQKAAQVVADTVVAATGSLNLQEATEKITSDDAARAAASAAVLAQPEIAKFFEVGGGVESARKAANDPNQIPVYRNPAVIVAFALLPLVYLVVYAVVFGQGYWSDEMRSVVVTAVVTGLLGSISGYFLGSSYGSARKDQVAGRQ